MTNTTNTTNQIGTGDRVTDGDEITGHVVKANTKRALVAYWGSGLSEGKLVKVWLSLSSLTVVRSANTY